ncbi:MAG TPA: hypothetical protein PLZ93_15685 [Nocardioides sp.]|uniref:hypothetical protein n=1 Tax=uncultured Nocardioides sp. TaxID=198441 RepID=UPI000EE4E300|nr:hypothetical protein [uncultured Nocardioides sp.]HCB03762.1 hypothetical protein [Nocardioides sp.]HRD60040.1 hypothetical protein [Nocardioides sp.]HRI97056.1 hypothetical protein [Nocardioides sp.]HRK46511.1 hypothetical protein [Nocardioides sp.]
MYVAWGDDLPRRLREDDLHGRLAAAGVRRLQLNLDDDDVAPAMRIAAGPDHIAAVLSIWTDSDTASDIASDSTRILTEQTGKLAGWEVEERLPISPPETAHGERMDALANIAVLQRPDELARDEWLHRWLVDHTPVAMATQATFGYVQNIVLRELTETPRRVDALVEELFPSAGMIDRHAFYGSQGDDQELHDRLDRLMASVARIGFDHDLDLVPSSRYVYGLDHQREQQHAQ